MHRSDQNLLSRTTSFEGIVFVRGALGNLTLNIMTSDNQSEIATDCNDHDHETEESGCNCGGICGRRELLEKFNEGNLEAASNNALSQEEPIKESSTSSSD